MHNYNIEITIRNSVSYLSSLTSSWNSKDLLFTLDTDYYERPIISAYSHHIESIRVEKDLIKRIISLNVLVNGALFIANATYIPRIEFINYYIENKTINDKIQKNSFGFWSDTIEEYPFNNDESYYIIQENRNLSEKDSLGSMLFSISKFDSIIRNLLFQAGLIFNNGINDKILTWNTLYKMVDTIKAGCKDINLDYKTLIDESSLEKFTASCNNPTVIGIFSRHGGLGNTIKKLLL